MPSYVIVGASRGLGFEFVRQLSAIPSNIVVGLVRSVDKTKEKVKAELDGRSNIHILHGDLDSYDSLKKASEDTAKITGGSLDYLIHNAVSASENSTLQGFSHKTDPVALEKELLAGTKSNVVGMIHTFNLFLPLIRKGNQKKVVFLTSGHADLELVNEFSVWQAGLYCIDKAGGNMVVAKYGAEYKKEGILFLSVSPGMVDTGHFQGGMPEELTASFNDMVGKFAAYAPHFTGPITPEASIKAVLEVVEKRSVENGDSGAFISHLNNKSWL